MTGTLLNDGVNMHLGHPMFATDEEDAQTEAPSPASEAYDPSKSNIKDVQAHVDAHRDQREAVLAAEKSGKNRKTLVEWLSSPYEDEVPAGDGAGADSESEED